MAKVVTDDAHYKAIADVLKQRYFSGYTFKPAEMAEFISIAFSRAKSEGHHEGWNEGVERGHLAFWDKYQQGGERANYLYAFAGPGWTEDCITPIYDMKPTKGANRMFQDSTVVDLPALLERCGVTLDLSQCKEVSYLFAYCYSLTKVGVMDFSSATYVAYAFYYCRKLVTVEKLIVSETTPSLSNCFTQCSQLKNIVVEGTIAYSISFTNSTALSVDSMKSIIGALKNFVESDPDNVNTQSIKLPATCWTALENSGTAPHGGTWKDYVYSVLGWNY